MNNSNISIESSIAFGLVGDNAGVPVDISNLPSLNKNILSILEVKNDMSPLTVADLEANIIICQGLKDNFEWFSQFVIEYADHNCESVLDIACNDGSQLDCFKSKGVGAS